MRGTPVHGSRQSGRSVPVRTPAPAPTPVQQRGHGGHDHDEKPGRYFGDRDWVLPYSIGFAVFGLGLFALLTVGSQSMEIGTLLAFVGVVVWFVIGFVLIMVRPVMIGVNAAPKKFLRMVMIILIGLTYIVVSGVLMANFSLPI